MTNMWIQPLWLTHFIEILLVLEFQLTKFIVGVFPYKAHFRLQISSNVYLSNSWDSKINPSFFLASMRKRRRKCCRKSKFSSSGALEILPSLLFFIPLFFQRVCKPFDPFSMVKMHFILWFHQFLKYINKKIKWDT